MIIVWAMGLGRAVKSSLIATPAYVFKAQQQQQQQSADCDKGRAKVFGAEVATLKFA
jgi:hypothetical protein